MFGSSARNLVSPRPPANVFQVYAKVIAAPGCGNRPRAPRPLGKHLHRELEKILDERTVHDGPVDVERDSPTTQYNPTLQETTHMDANEWMVRFSARLHAQWPRLPREQRDELAAEVHHERRWQQLDPENAAVEWLGQGIPLEGQRRAN